MSTTIAQRPAPSAGPGPHAGSSDNPRHKPEAPGPREPAAETGHQTRTAVRPAAKTATAPAYHPDQRVELVASGEQHKTAALRLAAQLDQAVSAGARHLIVDLARVIHLEGPAARELLHRSWRLEAAGGTLRLTRSTPSVRRVLRWRGAGHLAAREAR